LGFRISLFLFLTAAGTLGVSFLVSPDLPYGTIPVLAGSLVGGWVALALDHRGPGALGFYVSPEIIKESVWGMGVGVLVASMVVVGMVLAGTLRWVPEVGDLPGYLKEAGSSLWAFGFPAAAEEALMRGYLLQALAEAWGGGWGLWITSILFGALHLGNPNVSWIALANILLAGLFLGVVYLRTASLWWATGVHLGWNWAHGFLADVPVSGLDLVDAPLLEPVVRGPIWLSGGSFGPEGSVFATVTLVGATWVLWRTSWLRPGRRAREVRPLCLNGAGAKLSPATAGGETTATWENENEH